MYRPNSFVLRRDFLASRSSAPATLKLDSPAWYPNAICFLISVAKTSGDRGDSSSPACGGGDDGTTGGEAICRATAGLMVWFLVFPGNSRRTLATRTIQCRTLVVNPSSPAQPQAVWFQAAPQAHKVTLRRAHLANQGARWVQAPLSLWTGSAVWITPGHRHRRRQLPLVATMNTTITMITTGIRVPGFGQCPPSTLPEPEFTS
jgi:hypothetical protein